MAIVKNSNGNVVINDGVEIFPESGQSIEAVVAQDPDLARVMAEEAFMNEFVIIEVAPTTDDNANPMPTPSVNGVDRKSVV